jgi:uncharacterized protein
MTEGPKTVVLFLLRAYQWVVTPCLPPACRYVPTCSEYAIEAVERHGIAVGAAKTIWRLLRCHPLAKGGVDPVSKGSLTRLGSH